MLESAFPAFVFCPSGVTWKATRELLTKLKTIQAETLAITDRSNKAAGAKGVAKITLTIPAELSVQSRLPVEVFTPIPYIIPAQLFAASLATAKGLNPDQPRTLSKVTQTI